MRATALLLLLAVAPVGFASEPGQPLDCSDWVFVEPGYSCSVLLECTTSSSCPNTGASTIFDAEGRFLSLREGPVTPCGTGGGIARIELSWLAGISWRPIAYIDQRCNGDGIYDVASFGGLTFDAAGGRLCIWIDSWSCVSSGCPEPRPRKHWIGCIAGFPTTFEILQTYTPTPNTLSFRVPAIPEGFPAADYFDTYYGDLATVGDWSQAQPLQCGYPASPPSVGEYLEVNDPLPNPDPGHGRYYVTAVHYQGQTRYGRKSMGGVLSGRDPGVLPSCAE